MKDNNKTNEQLLNEISKLNNKIAELEKYKTERLSTEQAGKQAEEALRKSELWLRNTFEALEEAVFVVTVDRVLISSNKAAEKMFGYTQKEFSNQSTEIVHLDHDHYVEFGKRIKASFDMGRSAKFEFEMKRKDGEIFPTEHTVSLLKDANGKPLGIVSVVRDITERKQAEEALQESEEKFRNFVETSADLVFRLTKTGRIDYVSSRVEDLYGYKPDELIGKYLRTTTPVGEVTKAIKGINVLLTGKPIKNFEINQKTKAGRIIPMEINAVPVYQSGKIVGFQGIMRDITERKQAEEKLKSRNKELETWAEVTTDRELKMLELKKEINELLEKSGEKSKYEIPI